jgi:glycosyltransferase involved in cell wall biosynthesis
VHDWFQGHHGAERVVDAMRSGLFAPDNQPDIYTFHAARDLLPEDLARVIVQESRLAKIPGIRQRGHHPGRWRYLLPYMGRYFRRLRLAEYDLVIASSHAFAAQARPRAGATYVCYCHTPMRYAWLPEIECDRVAGLKRHALRAIAARLRSDDVAASERPNLYVANSSAVRARIKSFYGRDSVVVHPPVDVAEFTPTDGDPDHFLCVHRLVAYKRPHVVVEAFRGLPCRLTMVGVGPLESELRATLPPNVELKTWLSRDELVRLYEAAGGFIHVGEEDFGMTMVEALAAGTPVIALARGGALDIVRDGVDGVLIDEARVADVRTAVLELRRTQFKTTSLVERSANFSRERFVSRLARAIASVSP